MDEDIDSSPGVTAAAVADTPRARPMPPRRGSGLLWLVALLALAAAGVALWRVFAFEHDRAGAVDALRSELSARIDVLSHAADQRKRSLDSLGARMRDADRVNDTERDQLLSLGERSRRLEEGLANLAEQRLSGREAMARSDAEFLLQQAAQRLTLFHDANAAIAAYQLADSTLAAGGDPAFGSVREMIKGEIAAVEASKPLQVQAALTALERVRTALATLPRRQAAPAPAASASRWQRFVDQFVHVSHGDDVAATEHDSVLARELIALDLREAEAALLARDADAYKKALAQARAGIESGFDAASAPAQRALAELAGLASEPLAPAIGDVGGALKELRNLHVTRTLAEPPPAPSPAQPAPPSASQSVPAPGEAGR